MVAKTNKYPSKQNINLAAIKTQNRIPTAKLIIFSVVIIIIAFAFAKFAVADRFINATRLQQEVSELRSKADAIKASTADFSDVKQRYDTYCAHWLTEEELSCVSRTEILALVEGKIMPHAQVVSLSAVGYTLAVNLLASDLEDTAEIVSILDECDEVESIEIYTASSPSTEEGTVVSLIITMKDEGGAQK